MGQQTSRENQLTQKETVAAHELKQRVDIYGPKAIEEYVREHLDSWKTEELKIGISGRIKTGKSTFINAVLGLRPNQPGAAKSGSGNTTQHVTPYTHPRNDKIVLFDFPGVGTGDHPKSSFMIKVTDSKCDFFLIFFDAVISDDDIWLVKCLKENNTPFCFVRSMIDQDIHNAEFDGKNADTVLEEVKQKVQASIASNSITRETSIFFISGRFTDVGEFSQLLTHMEKNIPDLKFESILFSISAISKEVIEMKYQKLKSRVKIVTFGAAAISAEPIPGIDLAINLKLIINEIKHFIKTFGISLDEIEILPTEVKERLNVWSILTTSNIAVFITQQIGKTAAVAVVQSFSDLFIPIIGSLLSATTTYFKVNHFLNKYLDQMKEDALTVYDTILQSQK